MSPEYVGGSLSFDYVENFGGLFADRILPEKIESLSLSFLVESRDVQFGGTAGNIAYTMKLLGLDPIIIACAGRDFEAYRTFLIEHGLDVSQIQVHEDELTSQYHVVTDAKGNQIGTFSIGAMKYAKDISLGELVQEESFFMLSPTNPDAMVEYVRQCKEKKIRYMYDPAFQIATLSKEELCDGISGAEILIGNDYEIALIEKKTGLTHAQILQTVSIVVTTLGDKGALIETKDERIEIQPAKPENVSDPTGAGDAFRGGFLAGYLRGFDLQTCGQMGAVAAVYTVEKYGTVTHSYSKEEFAERYKENYKTELTLE